MHKPNKNAIELTKIEKAVRISRQPFEDTKV